MDSSITISVQELSKVYRLYEKPADRVKEALSPFRRMYHKDFRAVDKVSFDVGRGQVVAIFGHNGSGKSTLLKLVAGVLTPTSGSVRVHGRVSALLELGAGFNPELTGIQNVYLYGSVIGYSRAAMESRLADIVDFADIGDYVNRPVKLYSTGMFCRLAFSTYIHVDPDVLLVDEVLAVGDIRFQLKCRDRLMQLRDRGTTIVYVSHSNPGFGDWGMILDAGQLVKKGSLADVWAHYHRLMTEKENVTSRPGQARQMVSAGNNRRQGERNREGEAPAEHREGEAPAEPGKQEPVRTEIHRSPNCTRGEEEAKRQVLYRESQEFLNRVDGTRFGTGEVRIVNTELLDEHQALVKTGNWGQRLFYRVHMRVDRDVPFLAAGFMIRNALGHHLLGDESWGQRVPLMDLHAGDRIVLEFAFHLNLAPGEYTITIGASYRNMEMPGELSYFDWIDHCDTIEVQRYERPIHSWYHVPTEITARIDRGSGRVPQDPGALLAKYENLSKQAM